MRIKIVDSLKYIAVFTLILFSSIACEKDFEDVGVGLVDNKLFFTKDTFYEIKYYHKDITESRVDGIPQYLIGVYKDNDDNGSSNFGKLSASFVGQLGLPIPATFGDNVSIDTIILDIPYYATKGENNSDGKPSFKLDSIIGSQDTEFILSVHELGTFLNTLNPQDPSKRKKYYSNENYLKNALLYSGLFKPNANDTVLYVKRSFFKDDESVDTIKKTNLAPSIKIPLDTTFFRNKFINNDDSNAFNSLGNFIEYFRGVYIDAHEKANGTNGSLMTLAMSNANITIYYTNTVLTDEKDTDLNGDGDTDDTDVPVKTKQTKVYSIGGIRGNQYVRDESGSNIENYLSATSNKDKIFIQGAAGSMAVFELLVNLDSLKKENLLINEANITLYVDETSGDNVPEKLLLYKYDSNSQLLDVFSEAPVNGFGGELERNEDEGNKPVKYKFRITDYISKVLNSDNPNEELSKLGLKVLNSSDVPDLNVFSDTIITDFSWIAKGVVLKGSELPKQGTKLDPTRLKLEIFYTENNN